MFAAQAEVRWNVFKKIGLVAFAGFGGVAPRTTDFRLEQMLPSMGAGLRYRLSEEFGLYFSVDVAVGRTGAVFYVRIGKAF